MHLGHTAKRNVLLKLRIEGSETAVRRPRGKGYETRRLWLEVVQPRVHGFCTPSTKPMYWEYKVRVQEVQGPCTGIV